MDIQETILRFEDGKKAAEMYHDTDATHDFGLALSALQEQAEREKGCQYCCGEIEVDTPFCPYCGKRLK
jgi:hypothetical protein